MKRADILDLEWPRCDRDRHIATPVYMLLRRKYGLRVISGNIFNGYSLLLGHRPRMLMMASSVGATQNHEISLFAKKNLGIKVVSLISEGNMAPHNFDSIFWGWNREKEYFLDSTILWTARTKNLILRKYPHLAGKLHVSGNTGFDRYKILNFISKESFLKEKKLNRYGKVVGLCGWGFDRLFGSYFDNHRKTLIETLGEEQIEMHRRDMIALREIYADLIASMPETLFIIRFHPGCMDPDLTEFSQIDRHLPNVYFSGPGKNVQPSISDIINISDVWTGYETTTAIESWLLGKPVVFINPSGPDFLRSDNYHGVCLTSSTDSLKKAVAGFLETGYSREYNAKCGEREKILRETIGFWDGKCHERAAEIIYRIFTGEGSAPPFRLQPALLCRAVAQTVSNLKHFLRTGKKDRLLPDTESVEQYEKMYRPVFSGQPLP